jgi:hypothetical protein
MTRSRLVLASLCLSLFAAVPAGASTISINFNTPTTGLNILTTPLVTSAGLVTATASGTSTLQLLALGGLDNHLVHVQSDGDADYAQLAFSFDVFSIQFRYEGNGGGAFTGRALDASLNVLATFFDPDTNPDPSGPVTITSSTAIRFFRFADTPGDTVTVGIDDVVLDTTDPSTAETVPEPATVVLLGGSLLAGIARRRRRTS